MNNCVKILVIVTLIIFSNLFCFAKDILKFNVIDQAHNRIEMNLIEKKKILLLSETAQLKYPLTFLQKYVLEKKHLTERPEISWPKINFASQSSLLDFQNDIFSQWGFKPEVITNVYILKLNKIYLLDDASYYNQLNRCLDDSLVHELVHFLQDKYQNYDFNDESLEWEAIDIQTEFRNQFCLNEI